MIGTITDEPAMSVTGHSPARIIEAFVEGINLGALGFAIVPAATGRPSYHPATRLERGCQRNVDLMCG